MYSEIYVGIIGLFATITSGFTSWVFARKRYNSEVNTNEIENVKRLLSVYEKIIENNNEKVQMYIKLAEDNRVEMFRLKNVVYSLLNNTCLEIHCTKRKFYSKEEIEQILDSSSPKDIVTPQGKKSDSPEEEYNDLKPE